MITARLYSENDLPAIVELAKKYDYVVDWNHLVDVVILCNSEDGKIVGFGSLHSILECTFVIEKDILLKDRIDGISRAVTAMELSLKKNNYPAVHAVVESKSVENTLLNRFGFRTCNGAFLVKHVEHI